MKLVLNKKVLGKRREARGKGDKLEVQEERDEGQELRVKSLA